eukprot:5792593-Lingulodinium_polyedra.AAC.1
MARLVLAQSRPTASWLRPRAGPAQAGSCPVSRADWFRPRACPVQTVSGPAQVPRKLVLAPR